jgi:hypothetical protein
MKDKIIIKFKKIEISTSKIYNEYLHDPISSLKMIELEDVIQKVQGNDDILIISLPIRNKRLFEIEGKTSFAIIKRDIDSSKPVLTLDSNSKIEFIKTLKESYCVIKIDH